MLSAMLGFNQKLPNMQNPRNYDQYAGKQISKTQSVESKSVQQLDLAGENIKTTNINVFKDVIKNKLE